MIGTKSAVAVGGLAAVGLVALYGGTHLRESTESVGPASSPEAGALAVAPTSAALLPESVGPKRPIRPPTVAREVPAGPPGPTLPVVDREVRIALGEAARGADRPGLAAFRALSDRYVDANLDRARRQADDEGLSLAEVRELTHFGLLVLATQRVPDLEDLLGRPLGEEDRRALASLMMSANDDFKRGMRELVARGASPSERWAFVREAEAAYLADLYQITGMDEDLLDDLLAGNLLLPAEAPPPG